MTRDQTAALSEVTVEDFKDGRGEDARDVRRAKFKLHDKKGALVDLAKMLGFVTEKHEHAGPGGGPIQTETPDMARSAAARDEGLIPRNAHKPGLIDFWEMVFCGAADIAVLRGGRSSSKTRATACQLIRLIDHVGVRMRVLCIRRFQKSIQDSVYTELKWAIAHLGLEAYQAAWQNANGPGGLSVWERDPAASFMRKSVSLRFSAPVPRVLRLRSRHKSRPSTACSRRF